MEEPRTPERVVYLAVGLCVGLFFALLAGFFLPRLPAPRGRASTLRGGLVLGHSQRTGQLPAPARSALPPAEVPEVSREVRTIPCNWAREDLFWCLGSLLLTVNDFAKAAGRLLKSRGRCWELACRAAVRR